METISLGPRPPLTLADQGERLFYDARLSSDGWYSCHSCHSDGHTNGYRSDTFGDGYRGSPKQIPSLLGTADTAPWAWNGRKMMLEDQIRKSIETTMCGRDPSVHEVQALSAYLMSLSAPPSRSELEESTIRLTWNEDASCFMSKAVRIVINRPTYTSPGVYDVGLTDEDGQHLFNPPSLIGVGHRRRLLHDGRAYRASLFAEAHFLSESLELSETQQDQLWEFLLSL